MADKSRKIVLGSDHFGLPLKNVVRDYLIEKGYKVDDIGVHTDDPVDYPDVGEALAEAVSEGTYDRGVLICGTGAGFGVKLY